MAFGVPIPGVNIPDGASNSVVEMMGMQLLLFAQDVVQGNDKKGLQKISAAFKDDEGNAKAHSHMMEAPKLNTLF